MEENKNSEIAACATENQNKKHRRVPIWVCALCIILAVLMSVCGTFAFLSNSPVGKIALKLKEIDGLVKNNFVGEINYTDIDEAVLSGYIDALDDKYAFYEGIEDAETVADSFEGNSYGMGVTVFYNSDEQSLQIYRIDSNGPAQKSGIEEGDRIIAVDSVKVADVGYKKAVSALKKNVGEMAEITLLRGSEEISITVEYEEFVKQSVYSHKIGDIGYICFTAFNEATVSQFNDVLDQLIDSNVKGLVFDLRDNGGGTVDSVCKILDRLVGECDLMTVEYADGTKKVTNKSDKQEIDLPMAVITNGATASASELFAATIRDMNKGVLVGNTTYGKGVMQRTYFLSDNSCIRFTVGYFYPAGGVNFDSVGLEPDYEVSFTEYQEENKFILGDEDPYIQKAIEVINAK